MGSGPPVEGITRTLRGPLIMAIGLYLACGAVGVAIAPQDGSPVAEQAPPAFWTVLRTNLRLILVTSFGGVVGGLPTMTALSVNGVGVGALLAATTSVAGGGAAIAAIGPHGMFELPALLLAGGAGFSLPWTAVSRFRREEPPLPDRGALTGFVIATGVAVVLTVVAAVVEVTLTPRIVAWLA